MVKGDPTELTTVPLSEKSLKEIPVKVEVAAVEVAMKLLAVRAEEVPAIDVPLNQRSPVGSEVALVPPLPTPRVAESPAAVPEMLVFKADDVEIAYHPPALMPASPVHADELAPVPPKVVPTEVVAESPLVLDHEASSPATPEPESALVLQVGHVTALVLCV